MTKDRTYIETTDTFREESPLKPLADGRITGRGASRLIILLATVLMALIIATLIPGGITASAEAAPNKGYKRIVALTPFAANAMAQMGVFPTAIGQTLGGDRRYVSGLSSTPRLAMKHPNGPNPEQLIEKRPGLIFSSPQWSLGRPFMESVVRQNAGKSGKVVNADPDSVRGAYAKVGQISRLINRKARGNRLLRQMKRSVRRNIRNTGSGPSVMVILGVGSQAHVFTRRSWAGDIVRLAGGRLITGGTSVDANYVKISNDQILREAPEVIIAIPHDELDRITDDMKDEMKARWSGTPAAANNRISFSTDNSLLQAGTDIGATVGKVRRYLGN